jgi:hypothetical protein
LLARWSGVRAFSTFRTSVHSVPLVSHLLRRSHRCGHGCGGHRCRHHGSQERDGDEETTGRWERAAAQLEAEEQREVTAVRRGKGREEGGADLDRTVDKFFGDVDTSTGRE